MTRRGARGATGAHTLGQDGATPSPATGHPYRSPAVQEPTDGRLAFLQDLEAWMRAAHVRRARLPDGTELELGDRPPTPPELVAEAPEQRRERRLAALREEMNVRYAHVGGWNGTTKELERYLEDES